ncbi:chemotaxis protein CheY [Nostoc linckia z18]|jgi:twitching motility two-component system response regulator PilG|uniref:Protein PatA n=2 Tax=Nostoc linckia TaxID=92942 RepID=A0A9Q5ZEK9_NOSLI|nr:response regulator [Nostoc linckia]PHK42799.1 chemotaxis protein CheY [Nostoc linckia z15]PHK47422.1 chemotaxis protein CheY [Nostoc linckia z16]PHJ62024.1 chemotaxis protein CheY [Nostoc linckia z1]PHJ66377.1 chemotaxis protein CheY [Nostoc linckia z3]PHJ73146.1 chemotaxis protein CheY [Nostoc linckia z2]
MQGNLNEIDICSILQLIELGQRTGQLWVEAHSYYHNHKSATDKASKYLLKQQSWFVFFLNGQIIYCQQGESSLSRISDYLRHYRVEMRLADKQIASLSSTDAPEYAYIWALLEQNIISPKIAASIIQGLVHETLFDLLSLHQGNFIFRQGTALAPQLNTFDIAPFVTKITKQVQEWKQLYPHIQSPEQLLVLSDKVHTHSSLPAATVNKLQHWADGKSSLRQLARYLNRDILTVAKAIYPYVQQSWLQLVYSASNQPEIHIENSDLNQKSRGRIVCIDDAIAIGETINSILQAQGYEAIVLTNPLEAISLVFQLQPDLILCDIAMSELEGYEVCAMLRHSTAFRLTPIVMLTGKDGFIDRVKASMVGATDYLTKPFTDNELLMVVGKYINN